MPHRSGKVFMHGKLAGRITQIEDEYQFEYDPAYLSDARNPAISFSIPKSQVKYQSKILFPFFTLL